MLLVHDLLLSKRGIACPRTHPLRVSIERHKARLAAELSKARIRRRCATLEALSAHVLATQAKSLDSSAQIRWVRINNLKTTFDDEVKTTFSAFTECHTLEELCTKSHVTKAYLSDLNIPDLLATNLPTKELLSSSAYKLGKIILQDKASCFPAHLALNSKPEPPVCSFRATDGDFLDACAAPGNKTSHLASILASKSSIVSGKGSCKRVVFACERDAARTKTLQSMLDCAGANSKVRVLANQDFLALDPLDCMFSNVTHLLLDPSCSGSGILDRNNVPTLVLPKSPNERKTDGLKKHEPNKSDVKCHTKKRKRDGPCERLSKDARADAPTAMPSASSSLSTDSDRLRKLSNLQTRIIEHAFAFPSACVVTYSTCSIHATENEAVVLRALNSAIARRQGWRLLRRDEQPDGLRIWPHRGDDLSGEGNQESIKEVWKAMKVEEKESFKEACIRCRPGDSERTMGFFVVGFVRDQRREEDSKAEPSHSWPSEWDDDGEWEGLSVDGSG